MAYPNAIRAVLYRAILGHRAMRQHQSPLLGAALRL
jgi:hypothetical protein